MTSAIEWLCEPGQPAIHYRTLRSITGAPHAGQAQVLYQQIWELPEIRKMLAQRTADGYWAHTDKEYGVHTSLRYLTAFAEYGLHQDERLDRACAYAVAFLREKETAALNQDYSGCSNALLLRALVMLGYHQEPDVQYLLDRYAAAQLADGGFICRRLLAKRPDRRGCFKAGLAALLLYAECRERGILLAGEDHLLAYFLKRDIFFDSETRTTLLTDGRPGWRGIDNFFPVESMRIGLPLVLAALAVLGAADQPALARSWALLDQKKTENGRYCLEGTLTRQPCKFGPTGVENKWITYYALLANKFRTIQQV